MPLPVSCGARVSPPERPMPELEVVGHPAAAVRAHEIVTGRALYTRDLGIPGTLVGRLLYTPIPCGRIRRLDGGAAPRVPGAGGNPPPLSAPRPAAPGLRSGPLPGRGGGGRRRGERGSSRSGPRGDRG